MRLMHVALCGVDLSRIRHSYVIALSGRLTKLVEKSGQSVASVIPEDPTVCVCDSSLESGR